MKSILIVDDDLGFVYWLGHLLDTLTHSALPAESVPDAARLVRQLDLKVDLLVLNPKLSGGVDFIAALRRSQPNIRVIGIQDDSWELAKVPGVNATHPRPTDFNESTITAWIECIEQVLGETIAGDNRS